MVHLIWEKTDGTILKGLQDCAIPSPSTKELVDTDLNHGVLNPGDTSVPQVISLRTFSWSENGDAVNPITDCGFFLTSYYTADPVYTSEASKTFCGGASTSTFGDYEDANGSHSATSDLAALRGFGDAGSGGVQISNDLGRTYSTFSTTVGVFDTPVELKSTAMDIGTVNGQLDPGDRATIYLRIKIPSSFNNTSDAGVYLFNLGLRFNYTE